ncbi:MAG: hypothetical protein LBS01_00955 [Prevotellaceae bacterium]|jgi:hypothetical protein|nr:hypothetical protein [Prevotellaceae bacterium]
MNVKKIYLTVIVLLTYLLTFAQSPQTEHFEPSGKIIARTFFDFSQGFGSNADKTGFNITRAFLGYSCQFAPTLGATVIIDGVASNANGKIEPHIRNAFVSWTPAKLTLNVGQTNLYQFSEQEKYWQMRYVLTTFQDLNKMGNSVDLGVTASWKLNRFVSADIGITNGEGYKKALQNSSTRYAAGVSLYPTMQLVLRAYGDIYTESAAMRDSLPAGAGDTKFGSQKTLSLFAGYNNAAFSGGIEFGKVWNRAFVQTKNIYGISAFASLQLAKKWVAFARYDRTNAQLPTSFPSGRNATSGQVAVAGVQFQPVKQLKIAPNFRYSASEPANSDTYFLYVNMEFNL